MVLRGKEMFLRENEEDTCSPGRMLIMRGKVWFNL